MEPKKPKLHVNTSILIFFYIIYLGTLLMYTKSEVASSNRIYKYLLETKKNDQLKGMISKKWPIL